MIVNQDECTIVAHCTPRGPGALALIRISGSDALSVADCLSYLTSGQKISLVPTHTIQYGHIRDEQGQCIDQVLFLIMHGPHTFTGHDTVEITCHNNQLIIDTIIARAIQCGARLAQRGEFTKRAYINKKIDLTQAEAINELIHAHSQVALKQSLTQVTGSLSQWVNHIEEKLIKALALSEASFEFIDEENFDLGTSIAEIVSSIFADLHKIKNVFNHQVHIREGMRIALIGSVNTGKSSLFNALLGINRSIVSHQAGTTRDVIEHSTQTDGALLTFIDTAGLRQTDNEIEREGITRSLDEAQKADIILLIADGSRDLSNQEQAVYLDLYNRYKNKIIPIRNKIDLPQHPLPFGNNLRPDGIIATSSKLQESIVSINQEIQSKIHKLFETLNSPFLLNQRHHALLFQLEQRLINILPLLRGEVQYELVSHHLHESLTELSQMTGKTITKESLDAVFREFCVGK